MLFLLVYKIMSLSMRDKMDEIILGDIIFTPLKRTLTKGGCVFKIRNKEAEVLSLLCTHYPEALSREDIEEKIWEGSYVTDNTLTQTISNLRHALDDKEHEIVTTIPKKGYCIGIKPDFTDKSLSITNTNTSDSLNIEMNSSSSKYISLANKTITLILCCLCLFFSFSMTFYYYQVKIINVKELPILVNLDETQDKEFLLSYNKSPYIFLKKQKNGDYNACKYQNGALQCEKK
ncbi:transcriptional regulator [Yersinia enterocolitica]|nr:transcriptional regulator [Yersinia enterocolitica]EKN3939679.1 transcriptional regulator [Yersinia enterocolitica]EKN4102714.1 transcriptional regulator [Yersinia enterocolitica]EKN4873636.1 transcriptional regulator [Yersinia enterocolitica]EKN5028483.1 transcriptional regulator [Yersinia enterocolitica]